MLKRWKKYERNKAQAWRKNQEASSSELIQAYRLYTLALAGRPELGAMNRLLEQPGIPTTASWMLAAAYIKAGQPEAGKKLIANLPVTVKPYQEMSYSYGSDLRDKAIILETLLLLQDRTRGFALTQGYFEFIKQFIVLDEYADSGLVSESRWSFRQLQNRKENSSFRITITAKRYQQKRRLPIAQVQLPVDGIKSTALKVVNESKGVLFVQGLVGGYTGTGKRR